MANKQAKLNKLILRVRELENFRIKDPKRFSGEFILKLPLITGNMSVDTIESILAELTPQKLKLSTNPSKYLYYNPIPKRGYFTGGALYSIPELQDILKAQIEVNKKRAQWGVDPIGSPDPITGVPRKPIWGTNKITIEEIEKKADKKSLRTSFILYANNFLQSIEHGIANYLFYNPVDRDKMDLVYTVNYLLKKLKTRDREKLGKFVYQNLRKSNIRITDYLGSDQDVLELGNELVVFQYLGISMKRVQSEVKKLLELDKKMNSVGLTDKEYERFKKLAKTYVEF